MVKQYVQESERSGLAEAIARLLVYIGYTVTQKAGDEEPDAKGEINVDAVIQLLAGWSIASSSYIITLDQLAAAPMPHITFTRESINGKETLLPVLLTALINEEVHYVHPVKGPVQEQISDFSQKWNNVVVVLPVRA